MSFKRYLTAIFAAKTFSILRTCGGYNIRKNMPVVAIYDAAALCENTAPLYLCGGEN